jgi:hypothetical protein
MTRKERGEPALLSEISSMMMRVAQPLYRRS